MRTRRQLAPKEEEIAYYHCLSRVTNRDRIFGPEDHDRFLEEFRRQAEFSGVQIVTYCLLENHFHILVGVPKRPATRLGEEEFFGRLGALYRRGRVAELRRRWRELAEDERLAWEERFLGRMWNLSVFMKEAKQRFTQWYNRKRGWDGPRWKSRFQSVLVGVDGRALATMAAYIDLNPVRAGIVEDPKDYRWSGYHEAMAGNREAREAYGRVIELAEGQGREDAFEAYRVWLFRSGEQRGIPDPEGLEEVRKGIDPEKVKEMVARRGRLSVRECLMCRIRHLSEGAVFGTKGFVERMLGPAPNTLAGPPKTAARSIGLPEWGGFHTLKVLRRTPREMASAELPAQAGA